MKERDKLILSTIERQTSIDSIVSRSDFAISYC